MDDTLKQIIEHLYNLSTENGQLRAVLGKAQDKVREVEAEKAKHECFCRHTKPSNGVAAVPVLSEGA